MFYLTIKSIHIVSVILWIGGLFLVTFVTSRSTMTPPQIQRATRISDTAIGIAWLAGIVLVVMGGWYTTTWWYIKMIFVIALSAIHSITHRRWKTANESDLQTNSAVPPALFALTVFIVFLVVFKRPV